jgi:hypothetical protein
VPAVVGVPEITPVFEIVNPAGSVPDVNFHVYPGVPPVAASVTLYGDPAEIAVRLVVESASGGAVLFCEFATVTSTEFDCVPFAFFTFTCATVGCASALLPTCTASVSVLTTVVGSAVSFSITADFESKFAPFTVSVTLCVPAVTTSGDTALMLGLLRSDAMLKPDPHPAHATTSAMLNAIAFIKFFTRNP